MSTKLINYNYSKQYILNEKEDSLILKNLKENTGYINADDYQWKIVTTVSKKLYKNEYYHLIQYDDQKLGWIQLKDSIQIFRFDPKTYKLIDTEYYSNDVNDKLGFDKDFLSAFSGKLLTVKSEINYKNTTYYGVFIKNRFQGFHPAEILDEAIDLNIEILPSNIIEKSSMYVSSSLKNEIQEDLKIESAKIVVLFSRLGICKIQVNNKDMYWTEVSNLEDIESIRLQHQDLQREITYDEKHLNDIFYSINIERNKTKQILKTVLSAKEFLKGNNNFTETLKNENREINRLRKELRLAEERLKHQKEYNERLTQQKNKYKDRMDLVENKLKVLDEKYKNLKNKFNN